MEKINILEIFTEKLLSSNIDDIVSIVSFGGLHREYKIIKDWSDMDIIIIWRKIKSNYLELLSSIISDFEKQFNIRVGMQQITEEELLYSKCLYNGMIINALKRPEQHTVLYGRIPDFEISIQEEKIANFFAVNQTLFDLRQYVLQIHTNKTQIKKLFPTLLKRTFKIVRASLELFEVFYNPYDESVLEIKKLLPNYDFSILETLIYIRSNYSNVKDNDLFPVLRNTEEFLEDFVPRVMNLYNEKQSYFRF